MAIRTLRPSAAVLGIALSLCRTQADAAEGRRPNLVFLFADQLRHQSVGYAGDSKAMTPNLDRLASEGVNFKNYVVSTPVCSAFRASLMTGKYASSTGVAVNELRINPNQRCIAHVLTDGGYGTGYIGKWHLWANQAGGHDRTVNAYIPPGRYRLGFDGYWAAFNFHHISYRGYYFLDTPERIAIKGYEPDAQTDLAIEFLKRQKGSDKPFALFVSWGAPHDPWSHNNVPAAWLEKFKDVKFPLPPTWQDTPDPRMDRNTDPKRWLNFWKPNLERMQRVYYAMTANVDWNVGRVLKTLKDLGLEDDTIVVFTSDHGEMFGANGRVYKMTFYEEAARVPLLIRWPGKIPAGLVSDACMASPDIMPTLLGLTGLPIPKEVEGMDLSHLARGRPGPEPPFAFLQGMGHTYLWRDGFEWRALRDKRHTYAVYRSDGKELLFDNVADPGQSTDLAADPAHRETLADLRGKLKARMARLGDPFEKCSWYRDHWTDGKRNITAGGRGPFAPHRLDGLTLPTEPPAEAPRRGRRGRKRFNLKDGDALQGSEAPHIAGKGVRVSASLTPSGPNGVIVAHGGEEHGYALYLKDGKLAIAVRHARRLTTLVAPDALPAGRVEVTGELAPGGMLTLTVGGHTVATGQARGPFLAHPKDGLDVRRDALSTVADGKHAATGFAGTLHRLRIDVLSPETGKK